MVPLMLLCGRLGNESPDPMMFLRLQIRLEHNRDLGAACFGYRPVIPPGFPAPYY